MGPSAEGALVGGGGARQEGWCRSPWQEEEELGVSLLSEVIFPLGLVLSWEETVGLVTKDDPGWAESVESST